MGFGALDKLSDSFRRRRCDGKIMDYTDVSQIIMKDGSIFNVPEYPHCITFVYWRYNWDDIRRTDKVIDLGANVGGWCIPVSKLVRIPIMAIEPVLQNELQKNIDLNNANVSIVKGTKERSACIGDPAGWYDIKWRGITSKSVGVTIGWLINVNKGCDFLKMEIEGAEWNIDPEELDGIRRIEGQLHDIRHHRNTPLIKYLEDNYYIEYSSNCPPSDRPFLPVYGTDGNYPMIHCYRREP